MTDQEINIACAEAHGWKEAFPKDGKPHEETKRAGILLPYYWVNERTHERAIDLPDYTKDFKAVHELEKTLGDSYQLMVNLAQVTTPHYWGFATARQRAEAFLKTIGKWKD